MIKGFKEFVFRGNVIDLAVAVAVGTALAALVAAVTQSLIEPIVGWILSLLGGSDGSIGGTITLAPGYEINFALLIGAVITFFVTLAALYFLFVLPMNKYRAMTGQGGVDTRPPDVQLLEEIRDLLKQQAGGPDRGGPAAD
ncbi:MAG: MscL family protein [Actinobacteria bacterium]|jgi:large conductance mechanosensitive channel|nr:MscL family protein [Actinomycetota bacterium]